MCNWFISTWVLEAYFLMFYFTCFKPYWTLIRHSTYYLQHSISLDHCILHPPHPSETEQRQLLCPRSLPWLQVIKVNIEGVWLVTFLITMLIRFVSSERIKKIFWQVIREALGNQDDGESQAKAQKYCFHPVLNCPVSGHRMEGQEEFY